MTLGLCSQRELDAVVAKAAKKAGIEPEIADDTKLGGDKQALIAELHEERAQAVRDAEAALSGETGGDESAPVEHTAETLFKDR